MIKKIKPAILILTHFLLLQGIYGQNSSQMTDFLRLRFIQYCKAVPREEIFIHTDREEYISGENLWFSTYLIDRQSFNLSSKSSIVYFELLNSKNRPVVQKRIFINKGSGPGQILLPDTLSTGTYTIRAYTSWMKNFLPSNCFMKNILVYNAINSKSSKIVDSNIGTILSTVSSVPELKVRINNSKADSLEINIEADGKFRDDNKNTIYIFIQTHGNINYVNSAKLTGESTTILLPKTLMISGINQITFFNSSGKPVSEKYIYTPEHVTNRVSVNSVDSCSLRDRIVLEIELQSMNSIADSSCLSISVSPIPDKENDALPYYMIFGTEFGANLYGKEINKIPAGKMDSLLTHLKSNWINWDEIISGEKPHFKYPAENENNLLMGDLVTNSDIATVTPEYVLMCNPGKEAEFQYARTDSTGHFCFRIHIDEGLKDLIIMPDNSDRNHKINIESSFADKFLARTTNDSSRNPSPSFISKLSVNHQVQKIYGNTDIGAQQKTPFKPVIPARFYGEPDVELVLADYIKLPVMSEIIFELLPGVSLKTKKSGDEISVTYRIGDIQFTTLPCLMIDGVIIKDASLIVNLDPEIVEKIDVIREKYLVGRYFFPGIINVITKAGDFSCVSLPDYMIRMPYRVIDQVSTFISPDYSSVQRRDSRIPDYRNTLYWNPSVKTDKEGKARVEFFSSDNKADYVINIEGITGNGKVFSAQKILKVR